MHSRNSGHEDVDDFQGSPNKLLTLRVEWEVLCARKTTPRTPEALEMQLRILCCLRNRTATDVATRDISCGGQGPSVAREATASCMVSSRCAHLSSRDFALHILSAYACLGG